jgi:kynurenine formamidase
MQIIDISRPLENTTFADPPGMAPQIQYLGHHETADMLLPFFPGLTRDELPGGEAWATEIMTLSTHSGTHMDAPWHYHSTMDEGARAITIDELPLEWCFGRGVKLDFRALADGHVVTPSDIEAELRRIHHELRSGDIVLVNTAAGALYGTPEYVASGCGIGGNATLYLTERGVRIVGTDAWSWDAPFVHTARRYAESRDASLIWEGHRAGMKRGYGQMEKLGNLERLPSTGFYVICLPVNVKGASAGWCRPVAILGDSEIFA